jgi:non-specific riboncleoside hydrolase
MDRIPIIIDTDPGIDDAVALGIALSSPELDVRLITTVAGNVSLEKVTRNVQRLLWFFHKDVPVAAGAKAPLIREFVDASDIHGASGLDGFEFEEPGKSYLLEKNAVDAMCETIMGSDEPITLVPIGPLTNVALLLKVHPEVRENISRIVMMGGTASRGNKGVLSEFNIATDPEAAKIVFDAGIPMVMVGLDVGWKALVMPEDINRLPELNETGKMIHSLFRHYRGGSMQTGLKMYDCCAMAYLLDPGMYQTVDTHVDVELAGSMTAGCTLVDLKGYLHGEDNATVCMDVDHDRFRSWFMASVARCR